MRYGLLRVETDGSRIVPVPRAPNVCLMALTW